MSAGGWREQRGSTSIMLISVWMLMTIFLGFIFDLGLAMVVRQQMRTALESAAHAGAQQADLWLTVRLPGTEYRWEQRQDCTWNEQLRKQICTPQGQWLAEARTVTAGSGWHDQIWFPGREPWQVYPQCSHPAITPPGVYFVCDRPVATDCMLRDRYGALPAARRMYQEERRRWAGRVAQESYSERTQYREGNPLRFGVDVSAAVELPTMFLKLFGLSHWPVRVRGVAGNEVGASKEWVQPPCGR